jgi:hypothetical protein
MQAIDRTIGQQEQTRKTQNAREKLLDIEVVISQLDLKAPASSTLLLNINPILRSPE